MERRVNALFRGLLCRVNGSSSVGQIHGSPQLDHRKIAEPFRRTYSTLSDSTDADTSMSSTWGGGDGAGGRRRPKRRPRRRPRRGRARKGRGGSGAEGGEGGATGSPSDGLAPWGGINDDASSMGTLAGGNSSILFSAPYPDHSVASRSIISGTDTRPHTAYARAVSAHAASAIELMAPNTPSPSALGRASSFAFGQHLANPGPKYSTHSAFARTARRLSYAPTMGVDREALNAPLAKRHEEASARPLLYHTSQSAFGKQPHSTKRTAATVLFATATRAQVDKQLVRWVLIGTPGATGLPPPRTAY